MSIPNSPEMISASREAIAEGVDLARNFKDFLLKNKFSSLRDGLLDQRKRIQDQDQILKRQIQNVKKAERAADSAKQVTDSIKQGKFNKVGGKFSKIMAVGGAVTGVIAIGTLVYFINVLRDLDLQSFERTQRDLDWLSNQLNKQIVKNNRLEKQINSIEKQIKSNNADYKTIVSNINKALKNANDALAEVRSYNTKLNNRISAQKIDTNKALKNANDALAEVRSYNTNLNNRINQTNAKFDQLSNRANSSSQKNTSNNFESRITALQNSFNSSLSRLEANQRQEANTRSAADADLRSKFNDITSRIPSLVRQQVTTDLSQQEVRIISGVGIEINRRIQPLEARIDNNQSALSGAISNLANNDVNLQNQINQKVNSRSISSISRDVAKVDNDMRVTRQTVEQLTVQQQTVQQQTVARLDVTQMSVAQLQGQLTNTNSRINNIEKKMTYSEAVSKDLQDKLTNLTNIAMLIPARVVGDIPNALTNNSAFNERQIINAATGGCRNTQPGGCSRKMLDDAVGDLNDAASQRQGNLLNALNTGANAAQMTLLNTINGKLGEALPGGLSGKLNRLGEWLHLDRALNILIWWQTLHNAAMLSSNVFQTLGQAVSNVMQFIGIKDDDGNPLDFNQILGKTYESMMKAALGEETYNNLNKAFNAANRIYQSAANIAMAIQSIQQSILSALEVVGAGVARIANAFKAAGQVFENAYQWMNPQPNFDNPFFRKLEQIQQTASNIEMVSQTPLDVKASVDSIKEEKRQFSEALKDGENALKGLGIIESDNQKNAAVARKVTSQGRDLDSVDKIESDD